MAAAGRKRDIAIRVMVTAKEQAELRKAAMPMSTYVRAKARGAAVNREATDQIERPMAAVSPPASTSTSRA
jgi:hypothetical protein